MLHSTVSKIVIWYYNPPLGTRVVVVFYFMIKEGTNVTVNILENENLTERTLHTAKSLLDLRSLIYDSGGM